MKAVISLGSNVAVGKDSPFDTLSTALDRFSDEKLEVSAISRWFQSPAYPAESGPDFTNAIVLVSTVLPPEEILLALHRIESQFGRVRTKRWGPRTLDLDLIAVADQIIPDAATLQTWIDLDPNLQTSAAPDQLLLPHPRMQDRAFVLLPMCDVAPDWVHPVFGLTAKQLLQRLPADSISQLHVMENTG